MHKLLFSLSQSGLCLSKIVFIAIALMASVIDPIFIYCPACGRCLFTRSVNVYSVSYPAFVVFVFTLIVSVYASKAIHSLNAVQPFVQLPTISKKVANKTKEDQDGMDEEMNADNSSLEEINIENLLNEIEDKENIQEDTDEPDPDPGPSTSQNVPRIHFEKHRQIAANNFTDNSSQGNIRNLILRKTLTMNLLTLVLLISIVPRKLIEIIYENCDSELGECDFFFKSFKLTALIQLAFAFIHPLIVLLILDP